MRRNACLYAAGECDAPLDRGDAPLLVLVDPGEGAPEARELGLDPGAHVLEPTRQRPRRPLFRDLRPLEFAEIGVQELALVLVAKPERRELGAADPAAVRGRAPEPVAQGQLEHDLDPVRLFVLLEPELAEQPGRRPQTPLERGHDLRRVRDPEPARDDPGQPPGPVAAEEEDARLLGVTERAERIR